MPPKYTYVKFLLVQFYFLLSAHLGWAAYSIPELTFEALTPTGLRVSIPDEPGIRLLAFHGRINAELSEGQPGELHKEVRKATNGRWVYEDPDVVLHVGDTIGYWVFVQYKNFGFRKDNLIWRVEELGTKSRTGETNCEKSKTIVNGKTVCKDDLIFLDSFERLDHDKWIVEKYIPLSGPNFEFNYYSPNSVAVEDSKLKISPIPKNNEADIRGTLDLTSGCTRPNNCIFQQQGPWYLPPVQSGMITSKLTFKYGRIEIDAKLPCGDWIYPEISLIPKAYQENANKSKIVIAYSRGNTALLSANGDDIGGKLLFSGYSSKPEEPDRSKFLRSTRSNEPYCRRKHRFTLIWGPDEILSYIDGDSNPFGRIDMRDHTDIRHEECFISLGVSVGGINDFPNYYTSTGGIVKPWKNKDILQLKEFFAARDKWLLTWALGNSLEVDTVRVYAV